ncbi:MAG: hypothetical protein PVH88_22135 [Ignavibacteria bacterium]
MKNSLVILFLIINTSIFAQDYLSVQLDYANNLFESKLYFDAVTEFKRLQFFDTNKLYEYDSNFKIGVSYKKGAKFDKAVDYLVKAINTARTEEEKFNAEIELVKVNILRKTTDNALTIINQLEDKYYTRDQRNELYYWRGWAYMFADNWEMAVSEFNRIDANHELKILSRNVEEEKYSETFAKIISIFIPGAGQIYTGRYLSGLMSLGWNILWGYNVFNALEDERHFDAAIVTGLLWERFYRGNVQNAENFAKEENIKIANKALRYLQNDFTGKKP